MNGVGSFGATPARTTSLTEADDEAKIGSFVYVAVTLNLPRELNVIVQSGSPGLRARSAHPDRSLLLTA